MNQTAAQFFESIKSKKITLCGIGVSHRPLIDMFLRKGAIVTACDARPREKLGDICDELEQKGATLRLGEDYLKNLDADIIFRTPGMKYHTPEFLEARQKGAVITSEMEVFFDLCPAKIFAVTGSDGKTTTSSVIAQLLIKQGKKVHLGGNIGRPLLPVIEEISPDDMVVVELSSFQLISMRKGPDISVVTNVAPNHLDIHKDMDEYVDAKKNIFLHQNAFSRTVLNYDNGCTSGFSDLTRGETFMFSRKTAVGYGAFVDAQGDIYMNDGRLHRIMNKSSIRIIGEHNVENYLAAICSVWGYVDPQTIQAVAEEFPGVSHRAEFIRELDGVKWYNDSIATSPTRTIAGLNAFNQRIILIAGGYDKNIPFEPLAPKVVEKVKLLVLLGATAEKIKQTVTECEGYSPNKLTIIHAENLAQAAEICRQHAELGDIISLSPACASFDSYANFEKRGEHFKEIVNSF